MSTENTGDPSEPRDPSEQDVSEPVPVVRAADVVDPAVVRRAPKFKSFVLAGILTGLILGLIIALIVFREPQNRTFLVLMFTFELTLITTLTALIWAVVSERRGTGKRRGGRRTTA